MIINLSGIFRSTREFLELIINIKRYYKTEEEFKDVHTKLKLFTCPHCRHCGFLILHGYLYGYSENSTKDKIKRGRRIFCSNRNKKAGCGRTLSILISSCIKNFMISAKSVGRFLENVIDAPSLADAFRAAGCSMGQTSRYRIFKLFTDNQVRIRTLLMSIKDPPTLPESKEPAIQTIIHLKYAFGNKCCPVTQFQHHFQTPFL